MVYSLDTFLMIDCMKFHRDFLRPLHPVFADEYVNLAPHAISLEDLEARDFL